ncbi:hypothetical protein KUTeg_008164 [Tegillarca granosa]|uniref:Uncharacterized protein n=1 Tax=Tegillarca granosa TaxID=220873 RepID=A0ABQ9FD59_TEGGR|nr:hypothetical protein KUTeg_008164 [Tegillarca granosa]
MYGDGSLFLDMKKKGFHTIFFQRVFFSLFLHHEYMRLILTFAIKTVMSFMGNKSHLLKNTNIDFKILYGNLNIFKKNNNNNNKILYGNLNIEKKKLFFGRNRIF